MHSHTLQVHAHESVPLVFAIIRRSHSPAPTSTNAGIVECAIKPPVCRRGPPDQCLDIGCTRHIGLHEQRLATRCLDPPGRLLTLRDVDVGDHDAGCFPRERCGGGPANAQAPARHQGDLAAEPFGHRSISFREGSYRPDPVRPP